MELCPGISLNQYINRKLTTKNLKIEFVKRVGGQLISAIRYMHSLQIVHKDLKPNNIVINQ